MSGIKKPSIKKPVNGIKKPSVKPKAPVIKEEVVEEKVIEVPVVVDQVEEIAPELEEILAQDEKHQEQEEEQIVEEVNEEPVVEEKPKAKKTRKSTKKKEEPKEESVPEPQETFTYMSLEEAIDCMAINALSNESWEEAKQEVVDKLNATMIDADADPGAMRELIGEIDSLLSTLRIIRTELEKNIKADIEYID